MAKTKFLASIAGKTLALAAAVMAVGLVLSACSKDKDTPQPPKGDFAMIDGKRLEIKNVRSYRGSEESEGGLIVFIEFSEHTLEHYLLVEGEAAELHGKTIDLTKLNEKARLRVSYSVHGHDVFELKPTDGRAFDSGSLYTTVDRSTLDTEINLTNGKLTYKGKEHTVSLYYKGKAMGLPG